MLLGNAAGALHEEGGKEEAWSSSLTGVVLLLVLSALPNDAVEVYVTRGFFGRSSMTGGEDLCLISYITGYMNLVCRPRKDLAVVPTVYVKI